MSKDKVTLQDVADRVGVSRVTVYRALNNKEGMSEHVRRQVVDVAAEMGYEFNYLASSLKRRPIRLAVVMSEEEGEGRYYVRYFWDGYRAAAREFSQFNIEIQEYPVRSAEETCRCLRKFTDSKENQVDGILLTPYASAELEAVMGRLADLGIGLVLLDMDFPDVPKIFVVKPDERLAGEMAAELMSRMIPERGTVLVADGDVKTEGAPSHGALENADAFTKTLAVYRPKVKVIRLSQRMEELYQNCRNRMKEPSDVIGAYSVNARNSIQLGRAIEAEDGKNRIIFIGSEIFEENRRYLEQDIMKALIFKNPYEQGYVGFKNLFEYLFKKEDLNKGLAPNKVQNSIPQIILKANVNFFMK